MVHAKRRTYTSASIKQAFLATGIWPVNPGKVLPAPIRQIITTSVIGTGTSSQPPLPTTPKTVCQFISKKISSF